MNRYGVDKYADIVEVLVKSGADVNACSSNGQTLMCLLDYQYSERVKQILQQAGGVCKSCKKGKE